MAILRDMDPLQLSIFLMSKSLADKGQAEEIVKQDVDGKILLGMSVEQLKCHVGFSFGKATNLVCWLQTNSTSLTQKPVVDLMSKSVGEVRAEEKTFEQSSESAGMQQISEESCGCAGMQEQTPQQGSMAMQKQTASTQRGRKGKLRSELPPDPVQDISDLYVRIFHKKPRDEYPNMWGRGYLESYHPKAHLVHNKNVEKMRLFFSDVYNPVVAMAWVANFKGDKKSYNSTLDFIQGCVPQLEALVLTIRGVSMSVCWKAEDIMKVWFSEHKKHSIRLQRIAQIENIDIEKKTFMQSLLGDSTNVVKPEGHGEDEGKQWPSLDVHSKALMDIPNVDKNGDQRVDFFNQHSLKASQTVCHSEAPILERSTTIPLGGEEDENSDDSVHADGVDRSSPDHKRTKKNSLVVGIEGYAAPSARSATVLFGYCPSTGKASPTGPGATKQNQDLASIKLESHPVESGGTELVSDDEENPQWSSRPELSSMPGLKRRTAVAESSVSDTSDDFHSPIQSDTSTETQDSAKLKHPKKPVDELYQKELVHDTPTCELPRVTRSKLPTSTFTTKMANLKAGMNSRNTKENTSLGSLYPINKGKSAKSISATQQQAWSFEHLDEDSKLTIAFRAMKLRSKKEVKPQLLSFMANQNQRIQLYNAQSSASFKLAVPFPGYNLLGMTAALDLLVKWALEFRLDIVNPPKLVNGKLRLFANHIQDR